MLKTLSKIPNYVYLAGLIGGVTATYVFYTPSTSKSRRSKSNTNGFPRGLLNYKNECFINVILQSLAASDKVTEWLLKNKSNSSNQSSYLFDTLANIIIRINRLESNPIVLNTLVKESTSTTTVTTTMTTTTTTSNNNKLGNDNFDVEQDEFYAALSFKRALSAHNWLIQSEEHDCHELFHLIMDVLDEEQLESKMSLSSLNYFSPSHLKTNSRTSSKNPFHGYLVTQFQCLDCNYKYPLKLESFYSLSLTLPQEKSTPNIFQNSLFDSLQPGVTLIECINNYFKTEHISDMRCENCSNEKIIANNNNNNNNNDTLETKSSGVDAKQTNSKTNNIRKGFIKKQAIAKLPDCLCLQIQRNSWSDQNYEIVKQTNYVQFPLTIKIDNQNSSNNNIKSTETHEHESKSNISQNLSNILNNLKHNNHTNSISKKVTFSLKQVGIGCLLGGNSSSGSSPNKKLKNYSNMKSLNVLTENNYEFENDQIVATTSSTSNTINQFYQLKTAIVHYGSANTGHFVVYRKPLNKLSINNPDTTTATTATATTTATPTTATSMESSSKNSKQEEWLQISDSDIKRCKQYNLLSSNVYMLFYDKVSTNLA